MSIILIVTAAYNWEVYLQQTYNSIRSQTFSDWEWLVTDDCLTDGTLQILRDIAETDCRVKIFANDINSAAAVSRNKSLQKATVEFIAFINSCDL